MRRPWDFSDAEPWDLISGISHKNGEQLEQSNEICSEGVIYDSCDKTISLREHTKSGR